MISFTNFLADVTTIFVFVVWFWLLILIFGDLFRRHDISGWLNVVWVLIVILTSYIGVFIYLITQGRGIAERNAQQARGARSCGARLDSVSPTKSQNSINSRRPARSPTTNSRGFAPSSFSDGAFCRSRLFGHGFCAMNASSLIGNWCSDATCRHHRDRRHYCRDLCVRRL